MNLLIYPHTELDSCPFIAFMPPPPRVPYVMCSHPSGSDHGVLRKAGVAPVKHASH